MLAVVVSGDEQQWQAHLKPGLGDASWLCKSGTHDGVVTGGLGGVVLQGHRSTLHAVW